MDRTHRSGRRSATVLAALLVVGVAALASPAAADPPSPYESFADADVRVNIAPVTPTADAHGDVTYRVAVTNVGPDFAEQVVFSDPIASVGGLLGTVAIDHGSCVDDIETGTLTCPLGTLGPGQHVDLTYTLRMYGGGTRTNAVRVTTSSIDRLTDNNLDTTQVVVPNPPSTLDRIALGYFRRLVGRAPGRAELDVVTARINAVPFPDFVRSLTASTPFRQDWLDRQFEAYLGRPAGPDSSFLDALRHGRSYDDVLAVVVASREFELHQLGCEPGRPCPQLSEVRAFWVRAAYRAVTGEEPPARLVDALQYLLDSGVSRRFVARGILVSAAGRTRFVDDVTGHWLGRAATDVERFASLLQLRAGVRPERVEANLLSTSAAVSAILPGIG